MKERIAFVVHRYGQEINGGAEDECRGLAEHLLAQYDVEILTSCSLNSVPFDNYYPPGESILKGVTVRRFCVDSDKILKCRNEERIQGIPYRELQYIKDCGPYCPGLIDYLEMNAYTFKVVIFFTAATYITTMGLLLNIKNAVLIPTMHEDFSVNRIIYHKAINNAKGIIYNSIEERNFLIKNYDLNGVPSCLTCMGMEEYTGDIDIAMCEKYGRYIIYAGRISDSKNYSQLNHFFIEYRRTIDIPLKLIVIGCIDNYMKLTWHEDIHYIGFVSESEKHSLMHCADFLVLPSLNESLSIVVLESMMEGRPVLVNGNCAVLKGQCVRSNAGLWYTNYNEFSRCMTFLLNNEDIREEMGKNGRVFVKANYSWSSVIERVSNLIDMLH